MIDKVKLRQFHNEVAQAIEQVCKKYNVQYGKSRCTYNSDGALKFGITAVMPVKNQRKITIDEAKAGLAPVGTVVWVKWPIDGWFRGKIISIGRRRYSVLFDDGDRYTIPFDRVELEKIS